MTYMHPFKILYIETENLYTTKELVENNCFDMRIIIDVCISYYQGLSANICHMA